MRWVMLVGLIACTGCGAEGVGFGEVELELSAGGIQVSGFDLARLLEELERAGAEGYVVRLDGATCGNFTVLDEPAELEACDLRFGEDEQDGVRRLPLGALEPAGGGRRVQLELGGYLGPEELCAALSRADGDALRLRAHSGPY